MDLQTRPRRPGEGVYGGCPPEIYHGTQAKHAFGRRVSTGDKKIDATPLKMAVVLHVYDLGTDNVGSSLLQKVNGHALGAFHTALEIGWPHEHGSSEFPGAISRPQRHFRCLFPCGSLCPVFDLMCVPQLLMTMWHSAGTGWEWSFGYNDDDMTGVFSGLPKACDMHSYRESVDLGHTTISRANLDKILAKLEEAWHGWDYHMLTHNCVNFSAQLAREVGMGEYVHKQSNRCLLC